jgi:hypothetical protein
LDISTLQSLGNGTFCCFTLNLVDIMWTFLFGPLISIFPKRWRESLPFSTHVRWGPATVISGLAESVIALIALSYWYMYAMTAWVGRGVESALSGKMGPGVTDQAIGSVALIIWATHPRTLLLGYVGIEGAIRLCAAAFSDNIWGIFPLFLLDRIFVAPFRRRGKKSEKGPSSSPNNPSLVGAVRERMLTGMLPVVSDELCFRRSASEEILEIHASRRKQDWTPPRVVRYQDGYYRLDADSLGPAPRPFHYILHRLPAGVPGRTVLLYSPPDVVIREG